MHRSPLAILLTAFSLLALSGCGGGSADAVAGRANTVAGTYHLVGFAARGTTGATFTGAWGTARTNGNDGVEVQGTTNGSATPTNTPIPLTTYDLAVTADGVVTWSVGGTVTHRGGVCEDGSVALLGTVGATLDPTILLLIRSSAGNGPSNLAGDSEVGSIGVLGTSYGAFTGNATGTSTGSIAANSFGTITASLPLVFTTTVASDGTSDFATGATLYRGAVAPDGHLAAWAGDDAPTPGDPGFVVMARKGAGAAPLGTYHNVVLEYPAMFVMASTSGLDTFDGNGGMDANALININGLVSPVTGTATYVHNPMNGEIAITRAGTSEVLRGCVSPTGRYVIATGGVNLGSTPVLWIMCRQ